MADLGDASPDAPSEASFFSKLSALPASAGRELAHSAALLWFVLLDGDTPLWARAAIAAALVYFVSPLDAVPDVLPFVGYADDAGVLAACRVQVELFASAESRRRAREALPSWLR